MKTKIVAISDLHIKNNKSKQEYLDYFKILEEELSKLDIDYILFCGDLVHSKTILSPDSVLLSKIFLRILSKYCKNVIVIPGNHDISEKNVEKLDSISAILYQMDNQNIYYSNKSIVHKFDKFSFYCLSLMDKESWDRLLNSSNSDDNIKICLYHGPLKGAKTDLGFVFTKADDVSKYSSFDYMFCGDIHSHYSYGNDKFISVGNPIQQDFAESLVKGFVYYEIESKNLYTKKFIPIKNIYPYFNLSVDKDDVIPFIDFNKCKIRLFLSEDLDKNNKYKSYLNKNLKDKISNILYIKNIEEKIGENKVDSKNKIKYIDYIKDYTNKEELLKLYEHYIKNIDSNIDNLKWNVKKIKWSNLFSYGENNEFDFYGMSNKSIGIFGKNYSGKTSFIDVICFSLFGSWTKPFVKLEEYINKNKKSASSEIYFEIDSEEFSIQRSIERNGKNVKSNLIFKNVTNNKNLTQDTTKDTQKYIEKIIGDKESFLLTSLSAQYNNFSLLDEKNTKRKEYFSHFLGINKYNDIYKLAKEDLDSKMIDIKMANNIGKYQQKYFDTKIDIENNLLELKNKKDYIETIKKDLYSQKEFIDNIKKYNSDLEKLHSNISYIKKNIENNNKKLIDKGDIEFDENQYVAKKIVLENLKKESSILNLQVIELGHEQTLVSNSILSFNNFQTLLKNVPCENKFPTCKFISEASNYISKIDLEKTKQKLEHIGQNIENKLNDINLIKINIAKIESEIQKYNDHSKYNKILEENKKLNESLEQLNLEKEEILLQYNSYRAINNCELEHKDILEKYSSNNLEIKKIETEIVYLNKFLQDKKKEFEFLIERVNKITQLEKEIKTLETFCETVGKNGISVFIIKNFVPFVSNLMNKILSNYVDFNVELQIDEDKYLEIYIVNNTEKILIESASGSQKTIISYSLRLALLYYSQISISNLFILDEPATSFDAEHVEHFYYFLNSLKINDQIVILVTHIDSIKDYVDHTFFVSKENNYSKIIS